MTNYPPTIINRPKASAGSKTIKTFLAYIACFLCTWIAISPPIISFGILWLIGTWRAYEYLSETGKANSGKITTGIGLLFALLGYL